MFGCIGRLGCLFVLIVVAAIGWLSRDWWLPKVGFDRGAATASLDGQWEPVSAARAESARKKIRALGGATGPVFANFTGAEIASYALAQAGQPLGDRADSIRAAVVNDRLLVRANVPLRVLGGNSILGPVAGLLGDREPLQLASTFRVVRPGMGELGVQEIRVRDFAVPRSVLPKVVRQLSRAPGTDGVSPTGLPVPLPDYLGDVRIANGRITLYRTVPEGGER